MTDILAEEQERGITVEVSSNEIKISDKDFILLDCPGHRNFASSVLSDGLSQADIAVLVVSIRKGEFLSGMKDRIPEFLLFIKGYNVKSVIVAVNKMDTVDWNAEVFESFCKQVRSVIEKYKIDIHSFHPVSGKTCRGIDKSELGMPCLFDALLSAKVSLAARPVPVLVSTLMINNALLRMVGSTLISVGFRGIIHLGRETSECEITMMNSVFAKKGDKPICNIKLDNQVLLDTSMRYFVLRTQGQTIAVGQY